MHEQFQKGALILLFLSSEAFAAKGPACESLASLRSKVKSCEANSAYWKAGRACVNAYKKEVGEAQEKLAKELSALGEPDKQAKALDGAKGGYRQAIDSLKALAVNGEELKATVRAYRKEVVWPDELGSAMSGGASGVGVLKSQPCYFDSQRLLKLHGHLLSAKVKAVMLTSEIAEILRQRSEKGELALTPEKILPLLRQEKGGSKASGAPRRARGQGTKMKDSTITGPVKSEKSLPGSK